MLVTFADLHLERLFIDESSRSAWSPAIVRAFRRLVALIAEVEDERGLRSLPGLHFEKLAGRRSHQYSMRLNRQFRLVVEIESHLPKNIIHIVSIEDYH